MTSDEPVREKLWLILVETVHTIAMYPSHKAYTRSVILSEKPETSPSELSVRLKISLGEALVILQELRQEKKGK